MLADKSLRAYLVANMLDGEEGGQITMRATYLLDEVVEVVGYWLRDGAGSVDDDD